MDTLQNTEPAALASQPVCCVPACPHGSIPPGSTFTLAHSGQVLWLCRGCTADRNRRILKDPGFC